MLPWAMLHVQAQFHHVETKVHCRLSQIENLLLMCPWNSWNSCSCPSILTMHHTMCASNLMAVEPIYMNGKWFLMGGCSEEVADIYLPELSLRGTIRPRATSGEKKVKDRFFGFPVITKTCFSRKHVFSGLFSTEKHVFQVNTTEKHVFQSRVLKRTEKTCFFTTLD